jgi:hypothetical protein
MFLKYLVTCYAILSWLMIERYADMERGDAVCFLGD